MSLSHSKLTLGKHVVRPHLHMQYARHDVDMYSCIKDVLHARAISGVPVCRLCHFISNGSVVFESGLLHQEMLDKQMVTAFVTLGNLFWKSASPRVRLASLSVLCS